MFFKLNILVETLENNIYIVRICTVIFLIDLEHFKFFLLII